jgi:outer membrane immunogenic protein
MLMKRFLASVIGVVALGLAAPASAADVAARSYATPAYSYIPALYDWSGFYIGANGGYGSNHSCWDSINAATNAFIASEGCHNASGGVAGAQIGYRWQASSWVFGIDAQGDWASIRGSNINANPTTLSGLSNRSRIDSFGLFTAQLGFAMDNMLLYVKGGGAVVDDRYDIYSATTGAFVATSTFDQPRWGATAGAGLEYGFAANWTAAIEYDHLFMRDRIAAFSATVPPLSTFSTERIHQSVDMVTVRVNYRWGGPVIAKY